MYRGFNLHSINLYGEYYEIGLKQYLSNKKTVRNTLDSYITPNGAIEGSKMQEDWFPQIKADVFLSHSHKDERHAISLGGWLYAEFGITTFIDSCIWGYSDDLLKILDNRYCLNTMSNTYNYQDRNKTTAHVHMMLSTALSKMIDNTECLCFLNTPLSISSNEITTQTSSPWIYHELSLTKTLRINVPTRLRTILENRKFSNGLKGVDSMENKLPEFRYDVDTMHLIDINDSDFKYLNVRFNVSNYQKNALDLLYELHPIKLKYIASL